MFDPNALVAIDFHPHAEEPCGTHADDGYDDYQKGLMAYFGKAGGHPPTIPETARVATATAADSREKRGRADAAVAVKAEQLRQTSRTSRAGSTRDAGPPDGGASRIAGLSSGRAASSSTPPRQPCSANQRSNAARQWSGEPVPA